MGATEVTLRNLEVLQMQMRSQAKFAQAGLDIALSAIEHWQAEADGFRSDCAEKLRACESVEYFRAAANVFAELLDACQHAEHAAELVLGGGE
jgi:hypothetical protein